MKHWSLSFLASLVIAGPAAASTYVRLQEHPDLRKLYNAANALYQAASGCRPEEDCLCRNRVRVAAALERVLVLHVEHAEIRDTFILDERGMLQSEQGRGVLVNVRDLTDVERHLNRCRPLDAGVAPEDVPETEAEATLKALHAAEAAYYTQHYRYATLTTVGYNHGCDVPRELGFQLPRCAEGQLRYFYSVRVVAKGQGFVAEARSATGADNPAAPGCAIPDVWTIDQDQRLQNQSSAVAKCKEKKSGRH